MSEKSKGRDWVRAQLQTCLEKEVEVVTVKGEPIYGKLVAFSLDTNPNLIVIINNNSKHIINLSRVERIRVPQ